MQVKEIRYYDDETLELVGERFFVDGEELDAEDYDDFIGGLMEETKAEEVCECCECCQECDCEEEYEELLDVFTEMIQEVSPCPHCIKEILEEFGDIFIGDED